jgi:3-methyladenine DNA glycosylase AlkC
VAAALKHFFDRALVRSIAGDIARVHPSFPEQEFIRRCASGLPSRELLARGWWIAETLQAALPRHFPDAADILLKSLGPVLDGTETFGMAPFRHLPHVLYVQKFGLDHFEEAMQAQYELTQRFSAESSIRAYLVRYPQQTLDRLRLWSRDPSPHVRRLVSEGTRPRLPWAPRLPAFQKDPTPVIELLESLKDDPVLYVRRSVANNLNDIAKDHPDRVVALCKSWMKGGSSERLWIVRHALRSLVKATHPGALQLLGAGKKPRIQLRGLRLTPARVAPGGTVTFELELASLARAAQSLVIDYAVHYVKANGTTRPKVFKLRRVTLAPRASIRLQGRIALRNLTTRRHHQGTHVVELLINGTRRRLGKFELSA